MVLHNAYHLEIRNADIKRFIHACEPNETDICYYKCAQVSLSNTLTVR